jgi:hypothetical protein
MMKAGYAAATAQHEGKKRVELACSSWRAITCTAAAVLTAQHTFHGKQVHIP